MSDISNKTLWSNLFIFGKHKYKKQTFCIMASFRLRFYTPTWKIQKRWKFFYNDPRKNFSLRVWPKIKEFKILELWEHSNYKKQTDHLLIQIEEYLFSNVYILYYYIIYKITRINKNSNGNSQPQKDIVDWKLTLRLKS